MKTQEKEVKYLVIFNSTIKDDNMNTNHLFFAPSLRDNKNFDGKTDEEIRLMKLNNTNAQIVRKILRGYRSNLFCSPLGLDSTKCVIPTQKEEKELNGKIVTLDSNLISDAESKYKDFYDLDILADGLKMNKETPSGIFMGNLVADCANMFFMNAKTGEVTMTHCGGAQIDRDLISQSLCSISGKKEDIIVTSSPFAQQLIYKNNTPKWATNIQIWDGCIIDIGNSEFVINQRAAIKGVLSKAGILPGNIVLSDEDTTTDKNYFSNSAYNNGLGDISKGGRFLSCAAILNKEQYNNAKSLSLIKHVVIIR